jgi:cytochrome b561/polyisoprenoid-binding protein YceI
MTLEDAMPTLRNQDQAYGLVTIVLHWLIAALFIGQVAFGFTIQRIESMALQFTLIQWHKSFGFLILGLAGLRLVWALANPKPRDLPSLKRWERVGARLARYLLLVLVVLVPLAGWALVSTSTLRIPTLAFNQVLIPHLPLTPSEAAEHFWRAAHEWLAYATAAVAVVHIAAALRHHFWLRDGVLRRMLGKAPAFVAAGVLAASVAPSATARADALSEAAGTYRITSSSSIAFTVAQSGGGGINARFGRFRGSFRIDANNFDNSRVEITILPASVVASEGRVTNFLRSDAVFDAANHPEITFRSTSVTRTGENTARIEGVLTARGRSRPEVFEASLLKRGGRSIAFHVTGKVYRSPYGMTVGTPIYSNVVSFDMVLRGSRG